MSISKVIQVLRTVAFILVVTMHVSACGLVKTDNRAEVIHPEPETFKDEIATFAISSSTGAIGTTLNQHNQPILVAVGGDYISASKERCRRVNLTNKITGRTLYSAVCNSHGRWSTVLKP